MKKLLLVPVALMTAGALTSAMAQGSQTRFGIQAGASFSSMSIKLDGLKIKSDLKPGFTAGVLANFSPGSHFAIEPALNYTQRGGKSKGEDYKSSTTLHYLELPVNLMYQTNKEGGGRFFAGGGPSLSWAMGGKSIDEFDGEKEEYDMVIGNSEDDDLKPLDFGLNMVAGYQLPGGIFFSANYSLGLTNVVPGMGEGYSSKNQGFNIRIGYLFGGGSKK